MAQHGRCYEQTPDGYREVKGEATHGQRDFTAPAKPSRPAGVTSSGKDGGK